MLWDAKLHKGRLDQCFAKLLFGIAWKNLLLDESVYGFPANFKIDFYISISEKLTSVILAL